MEENNFQSDNGPISRINKKLVKFNNKKTNMIVK